MSIADKITRLSTAKTNIASAITTKGGTVQSGDGFEDFATDIGTIPSGITPSGNINITSTSQVDVTNYATAQVVDADLVAGNIKKDVDILGVVGTYEGSGGEPYNIFSNNIAGIGYAFANRTDLPASIIINCQLAGTNDISPNFYNLFAYSKGAEYIEINSYRFTTLERVFLASNNSRNADLQKIKLTGINNIATYSNAFAFNTALEEIDYELDFSSCTSASGLSGTFNQCLALTTITCKANTLVVGMTINTSPLLSDASLVSIANALNEATTGKVLTLHATPKARLSSIMGTVTLDSTSTYHIFTIDASGTTSLEDFISTTKGWSIA